MDRSLQTSRRIDVESVEEITPAVRSSKETSPAAPRNKVSENRLEQVPVTCRRLFNLISTDVADVLYVL